MASAVATVPASERNCSRLSSPVTNTAPCGTSMPTVTGTGSVSPGKRIVAVPVNAVTVAFVGDVDCASATEAVITNTAKIEEKRNIKI